MIRLNPKTDFQVEIIKNLTSVNGQNGESLMFFLLLLLLVLLLFSLVIFSFFVINHGTGFTLIIVVDLFVIVFVVYLFNLCS